MNILRLPSPGAGFLALSLALFLVSLASCAALEDMNWESPKGSVLLVRDSAYPFDKCSRKTTLEAVSDTGGEDLETQRRGKLQVVSKLAIGAEAAGGQVVHLTLLENFADGTRGKGTAYHCDAGTQPVFDVLSQQLGDFYRALPDMEYKIGPNVGH